LLLRYGADIHTRDGRYAGALETAASRGHEKVIRLLLKASAGTTAQRTGDEYGDALIAASKEGHEAIVQTLLDKGVSADLQSEEYGSALHVAAHGGHVKIVRLLLENGANPNIPGGSFGTALQATILGAGNIGSLAIFHDAADSTTYTECLEIVDMLIARGADVNAAAVEGGLTALEAAEEGGFREVTERLLAAGANVQSTPTIGEGNKADQAAIADASHSEVETMLRGEEAEFLSENQKAPDIIYIISHITPGCSREAERADLVAQGLDRLRSGLPEGMQAVVTALADEIRETSRLLRVIVDISQMHIHRLPIAVQYLTTLLPCLCRSLRDIVSHYEDQTLSREVRWQTMYNKMTEESRGLSLPQRFVLYSHFLDQLRQLLTRLVSSLKSKSRPS
jgi:ankyrin repeat protein